MTPTPGFKVTPFFDAEYLRNGTRYIVSHTPYSAVSFWITLSDLAKYSVTRSIAQPLCGSWATCFISYRLLIIACCLVFAVWGENKRLKLTQVTNCVPCKRSLKHWAASFVWARDITVMKRTNIKPMILRNTEVVLRTADWWLPFSVVEEFIE